MPTLTIPQLLSLTTHRGIFNYASLEKYPWLAAILYDEFPTPNLQIQAGFVLEYMPYSKYYILWTLDGWKRYCEIKSQRNSSRDEYIKSLTGETLLLETMKITDILGHSAEEMAAWSDEQRIEYCKEHFVYTRPISNVPEKEKEIKEPKPKKEKKQSGKDLAASVLAGLGLDLSALNKMREDLEKGKV